MNLLFVLLKNIGAEKSVQLKSIEPRGTMGIVWRSINEQVQEGDFDKKRILIQTGISSSHLDKITSELLARCYYAMFGDDIPALLDFLSCRIALLKLFYNELARQTKMLIRARDKEQLADFIRRCFQMIHTNMPNVCRDDAASARLAKLYISLFTGKQKREAEFFMGIKVLFQKMEMLCAATEFQAQSGAISREFEALGEPLPYFSEEVAFEYYWARIYFYHALEDYPPGFEIATSALAALQAYHGSVNELHILRIELKTNELLYYMSRFDEAYHNYRKVINSPLMHLVPERLYQMTKYIQLSMITGHLDEAGMLLKQKHEFMGDRMEELMIVRDIVTYVKYCLFTDDFDTAFRYIQLGFEKNPKGKYFQYEIELRNLQTVCFYLTGQEDVAIDMCQKHIKFLRNHGYTASNSDFPYFYVLVKAIFDKSKKENFSQKHQKMYDHYQQGSYSIYGKLLQKILSR